MLLPPGLHQWKSATLRFERMVCRCMALRVLSLPTTWTLLSILISSSNEERASPLTFAGAHPAPTSLHLVTYRQVDLTAAVIKLGPMTLLTVDEGYAAVTQNNGRQCILPGGASHLLTHRNWQFEKLVRSEGRSDASYIVCGTRLALSVEPSPGRSPNIVSESALKFQPPPPA